MKTFKNIITSSTFYEIVLNLIFFFLFIWWTAIAVKKYFDEPITTIVAYTLGDHGSGKISYPFITFCGDPIKNQFSTSYENCSFDYDNFFSDMLNCQNTEPNFSFSSLLESFDHNISKYVSDTMTQLRGNVFQSVMNVSHWKSFFHSGHRY